MERDFDVGSKVINITVDINNIPERLPDSKIHRSSKEVSIGNAFTAFRSHQNPKRFQTSPQRFSTSLNKNKNYKIGQSYNKYNSNNNQAPAEEDVSQSWQRVAQSYWNQLEGTSENGATAGEQLTGAKLVEPVVLKLQQKPNKLVSFHCHHNHSHCYHWHYCNSYHYSTIDTIGTVITALTTILQQAMITVPCSDIVSLLSLCCICMCILQQTNWFNHCLTVILV